MHYIKKEATEKKKKRKKSGGKKVRRVWLEMDSYSLLLESEPLIGVVDYRGRPARHSSSSR